MANNLDKIININNELYVINAGYSDTAGQTKEMLTIKLSKLESKDSSDNEQIEFNGSTKQNISIVPADGGVFTGRVKNEAEIHIEDEDYDNDLATVAVAKQITNGVIGLPLGYWADDTLKLGIVTGTDGATEKVGIITGKEADFKAFENYTPSGESALKKPENYLYICSDSDLIYFKTKDINEIQKIGYSATELTGTTSSGDSSADTISYTVKDILDLSNAITTIQDTIGGDYSNNESVSAKINELDGKISTNITNIQSNTTSILDALEDIGTNSGRIDKLQEKSKKYYQIYDSQNYDSQNNDKNPIVIIGHNLPSADFGNVGDIWIKYEADSSAGTS